MTIRDRISLTWRYGKGIFIIGAVYNLVCAGFQTELDSKSKICTLNCTLEELAVLRFLKGNPKATQEQIAKHLGRSERTIKSMTVRLTEKEYLIRKNGKRDGWWEVLVELPVT